MKLHGFILAPAALIAMCPPAYADDASIEKRLDAMQKTIEAQQHQIDAQNAQIESLRNAQKEKAVPAKTAAVPTPAGAQVQQQQVRMGDLERKMDAQQEVRHRKSDSSWSFTNGRPTISSRDGRFSLAIRALGQFDTAYYMQSHAARSLANGADLSSGSNFRRAQLGIQGKLFGDWSYNFNTEFGGSGGHESGGRVQALYLQYDGLKPFAFRIGAYPPAGGLEDNTSSADTLFLERAGPSDIVRNAVGGDGRDAASVLYVTDRFYGSLSFTGAKVGDGAMFDEQQAVLGRLAVSPWSNPDSRLVLSATGADMFRGNESAPGPDSPRMLTLSISPELTVDSSGTKLVSTGAVNTDSAKFWGVEAGGNWRNIYAQAGYFGYSIFQRITPPAAAKPDLNFNGWYAQASWVLTGESRGYSVANAAFTAPKPEGKWGAWELAGRYSDVDLNDKTGSFGLATPYGGVRGGEQKIWTAGINWYPNNALRFALDYQWIDVSRLSGAGANIGQNVQALSFRSQIAL